MVSKKRSQKFSDFSLQPKEPTCGITMSETRLFLENHSLGCHEIGHKNALENKELGYWKGKLTLLKEILDILVNDQQGIIKDLSCGRQ